MKSDSSHSSSLIQFHHFGAYNTKLQGFFFFYAGDQTRKE